MQAEYPQKFFTDRVKWRSWLEKNHSSAKGIWVIYYKKHTSKPTVTYSEAVEEALCFGWIDSTTKKLDEERFMQKFTPRTNNSNWSESNKKRVEKLIAEGKMRKAGSEAIKKSKDNGKWDELTDAKKGYVLSEEIILMIKAKPVAFDFYQSLPPAIIKLYAIWIMSASREETRKNRAKKLIHSLARSERLTFI